MSILQEILGWAKSLAPWQSDAVGRIFAKESLTAEDLDDLYALLKTEHGIPDPKGRKANPLADDKIPAGAQPNEHVELVAMKNLTNVNAIAEKQRLEFGPKGLTVIYGDNGSGKSGYSRVLKKACRARDQSEQILPNANIPPGKAGRAGATFEITINGLAKELPWEDGKPAAQELSSLAIFDSRCARAYLDNEDDFSYVPYGLDILEGLAVICRQFDSQIKTEQTQCAVDKTVFTELAATQTAAGKLVAALNAKTNIGEVEKLAALSPEESARRDELDKSLKADNPKEKATQLRLRAARITHLAKSAAEKLGLVDGAALTKLRGLAEAYHTAKAAAELAANAFKKDATLLQGTGGEAWKELFEAARKFAAEAYPDKNFPKLGDGTPCPLCQQPLNDGAARLVRFEEFVQQEAEKNMRACRKALADQYKPFEQANVSLGYDDVLFKEIEGLDAALANATRDFEKSLLARHKAIKQACEDRAWEKVDAEPASPSAQLNILAATLAKEAEDLEKAADEKARAALQSEFDELDARLKLGKLKPAVVSAVEKYLLAEKLSKCASAVKTNAITMKSTELAEKVISKELADALNSEFRALGAGNLHVTLATRAVKGKTLHKLKIDLPHSRNPGEILSEGEQRAIAIGSFLAEVNIGKGSGGVIFDDPVSSLDHKRRERVATRLVQEAAKRQVIVLTHDVYFLCVLMEEASRIGIPTTTQSLSRRPEGFGVADPSLPFEAMGTKSRVGALRDIQQRIAKLYKDGDEPEFRKQTVDCYRQLRIAWERAVEEVLLQNVVLRFRKGIETKRLERVVVEDSDYKTIEQAMTKCSNYPHDQALLGGVAIPEPDELLADINLLDDWRISVEKRTADISKRRKAAP
ncbi:AAA family ATPase [Betaproteobacteria bacterium SCN2]|jgi:energy-coupling factor transporter ATP-binding protein EcfA2|nr:AAA family ATPase [Betaproteobacteria bacterium SCN2]